MKLQFEPVEDGDTAFISLLEMENLPTEDLAGRLKHYFGLRDEHGRLVAAGGLELCGSSAILRSCIVAPDHKGRGTGICLVEAIIETARQKRLGRLFLLTETASGFFPKFGFRETDRGKVPPEVAASAQFSRICPQHAVAMVLPLGVSPGKD